MQSGYAQGKSDYQNNRQYDDTCNPNMSDPACALYKADYAAGWGATGILRPETCKQLVSPQRMKYRNRFNV